MSSSSTEVYPFAALHLLSSQSHRHAVHQLSACVLHVCTCLTCALLFMHRLSAVICNRLTEHMQLCRIQYTSGEIEELDLDEIIREGHMSLITQ